MSESPAAEHVSPWRQIFENVRQETGTQRDEHGVLGSINWLKHQMEVRGANPNVVRNIIYRDKGRLDDKRVLFAILSELWQAMGREPLRAPELEALLSPSAGAEQEIMQLLGREKMQAFRRFVGSIRSGEQLRLLITGRPGAGKTLLSDTIQQALELAPEPRPRIIRLEFHSGDLATGLSRLAAALRVPDEEIESRLVKVAASSAFAVQADTQADVARLLYDAVRQHGQPLVLVLHVSQSLAGVEHLGLAPLRLNTTEVPRVRASEWLWLSLLEPLSRLPHVSLLVSMTEVPTRILQNLGAFEAPVKLNPPTVGEARRFVRARLPHLAAAQQEALVQQSSRSFEELRTLTLLAEIREPITTATDNETNQHVEQLARLVGNSGDEKLRDFLTALAIVTLADFPEFPLVLLVKLRAGENDTLSSVEQAFLDPVPSRPGYYRAFSRQLARSVQQQLLQGRPEHYRELQRTAARWYEEAALAERHSEDAGRHLQHLFEAREWTALEQWMRGTRIPQSLLFQVWETTCRELGQGPTFERIALRVATHYVKLGSHRHPDALEAFSHLAQSQDPTIRAWTTLKQAEGALLRGWFDQAEELLADWQLTDVPLLDGEAALIRARIARWRGQLDEAARLVNEGARPLLPRVSQQGANGRLLHARVAIWAALISKDQGDLHGALDELAAVAPGDDLIEARVAYQKGDILLRLGCFDAALRQFDLGVVLARRSEALVSEQTRFLSRRGLLHGLRGDAAAAAEDFAAADRILLRDVHERNQDQEPDSGSLELPGGQLELDFWLARSNTDRAVVMLAEGRFQEAIFMLTMNQAAFERYTDAFAVDTGQWILRTTLYLALAYYGRGTAQPFRLPLVRDVSRQFEPADVRHARHLLRQIEAAQAGAFRPADRSMQRDWLLLDSLLAPEPAAGVAAAERALDLAGCAFDRAQGSAYMAAALLRGKEHHAALTCLAQAEAEIAQVISNSERSDLGLRAWLTALSIRAQLGLGQAEAAGHTLARALTASEFSAYHELLLRTFGEAAEDSGVPPLTATAALNSCLPDSLPCIPSFVRLPDALIAAWQEQAQMQGSS
jgi:tetratricopeptide (TPR) repeat protein